MFIIAHPMKTRVKHSTTDGHYTPQPKTKNTLLLKFLSLLEHKLTQIMKMIITQQAQRMNQLKT
jgi:hypothetical protein